MSTDKDTDKETEGQGQNNERDKLLSRVRTYQDEDGVNAC